MCMFSSPKIAIAVKMRMHVFVVCESKKKTGREYTFLSDAQISESGERKRGKKDVVVSPRHVHRLPSLPQ